MRSIETDYLIVGAGLAGMAFADTLVSESDADIVIVDRRASPGGHWNDAYPFVRLHMPSAVYGVNSTMLGNDTIDTSGPNAGYYERASAAEICAYFDRVLHEQLLSTGRVRFFGMSDYQPTSGGRHEFVSRLTGEATDVTVRRRLVDATYLESAVPATHAPSFDVDEGARVVPVGDLVGVTDPGSGFTVIGAGKTGIDACLFLLDGGVAPDAIRWIRPRDAWLLDRAFVQPLELVTLFTEGLSLQLEAAALAETVDDLFRRLEDCGQLARLDESVEPTMYHGATVSAGEMDGLRTIEDVVRMGRVQRIGVDEVVLEHGSVSARDRIHVDCSAAGLRMSPARTIFEPDRITLQQVRQKSPSFNAALLGFIEAHRSDDAAKNQLCPPNPYPDHAFGWIPNTLITQRAQRAWSDQRDLNAWIDSSRLNLARAIVDHLDDPRMQTAVTRLTSNMEPAIENLESLLDDVSEASLPAAS